MYKWHGIAKLIEECAELQVVLAKLQAYPDGKHPDERYAAPLMDRLHDELGDVLAAVQFFCDYSTKEIDLAKVVHRSRSKYAKLVGYHEGTDGMQGVWVTEKEEGGE